MRRRIAALCAAITVMLGSAIFASASADEEASEPSQAFGPHEDAILIIDGSGSMWGRINDTPKIDIARDVVDGLLHVLPAERRLGLMSYGHNRERDCTDIELLTEVTTDRDAVRSAMADINPRGRTPLSAAVFQAAEALGYMQTPATVILVSDGGETCDADPCAVGDILEQGGQDFTAHVIGFDIAEDDKRQQLACLAENTGGRFVLASDAFELAEALKEVVTVADTRPATLTLRATELRDGPLVTKGLSWTVRNADTGEVVFENTRSGTVEVETPPGVYDIIVERDGMTAEALGEAASPNSSRFITVAFELELPASVRLEPGDEAPAATDVSIFWEGPERDGDFVVLAPAGDGMSTASRQVYVRTGNPITLQLPVEPGDYEARYMLGDPQRILARAPITVTPVTATVSGPERVFANASFAANWSGPAGDRDIVTIVPADAGDRVSGDYAYARGGAEVQLKAPLSPGEYEVRYLQEGQKVLARAPITVDGLTATLDGPSEAVAGSRISVAWTGPGGRGDYVTVVKPDADARANNDFGYTRDAAPAEFELPIEPGDYELRYIQGGREILARSPITILPFDIEFDAPEQVNVGERFAVDWVGPVYHNDFIAIVDPEASVREAPDAFYARNGSPARLRAPDEPGEYELRYVIKARHIAARTRIEVVDE